MWARLVYTRVPVVPREILTLCIHGLSLLLSQLATRHHHPPDVQVAAKSSPPWAQALYFKKKVSFAQQELCKCITVCSNQETAAPWGQARRTGHSGILAVARLGKCQFQHTAPNLPGKAALPDEVRCGKPKFSSGSFIWFKMLCYQILLLTSSNFWLGSVHLWFILNSVVLYTKCSHQPSHCWICTQSSLVFICLISLLSKMDLRRLKLWTKWLQAIHLEDRAT